MDFSALVPYWRQWWDWKRAQSQEWENLVVSRHLLALPSLSVKMGTNDSCPVDLTGHLSNSSETISMKAVGKLYAVAAKSLLSCPTLCDPKEGSPPGSPVPGILQARTLEWGAIAFSNAWKWDVKVKSLSRVWLLATPWTAAYQAPPSLGFSRQEYWSGVPLPSPGKLYTSLQT